VLTEARIERGRRAGGAMTTSGGEGGDVLVDGSKQKLELRAARSGSLLAARRSSCGARRRWGGGEAAWPRRRGALRRAEVAGLALGRRGGGCVGRWGAGEGQGVFKKVRPASACGSRG